MIGTSDIDTSLMNKDLMAVTEDLAKLLEKFSQVSELEKAKVKR